ncbi:MAG: YjiH family protein [Streptosporangiales bacterium]|nr:YjiH family protein [Streptosporangiales bacterium]
MSEPARASPQNRLATWRFVATTVVGCLFFLLPIRVAGSWTVPFDVAVSAITDRIPAAVDVYSLVVILASAALTVAGVVQRRAAEAPTGYRDVRAFAAGPVFLVLRVLGAVAAVLIFFDIGPAVIRAEESGGLMFSTLVASVGVIVPIGAVFVTLFVAFGGLEFIGTLARPVMRPLFRVPGRAALDAIASFVGSYSVGLYVTNRMYLESRYSARESATIATCFSTVSMGFFAVVASTLDLLAYFPLIFGSVCLVTFVLGVVLCRAPPLSRKPDTYVGTPRPEEKVTGNLWRAAVDRAKSRAAESGSVGREAARGFLDGLRLAVMILPTILAVGLIAILIANHTPVFNWLGAPLEPVLSLLGIPDADTVAPASLIGISEMFLPALLSTGAAVPAKFFVAVLSLSQILFFSATIPLLLELDVPVRLHDCLLLFVFRTVLAIPLIAAITALLF